MKSILDPTFRYTTSANTDLRKTFARVRQQMRKRAQAAGMDDTVTALFPRQQRPKSQMR